MLLFDVESAIILQMTTKILELQRNCFTKCVLKGKYMGKQKNKKVRDNTSTEEKINLDNNFKVEIAYLLEKLVATSTTKAVNTKYI